ncbi:MAG: acyltransferase [Thermodesulfobacteriota bacterium]|nr:acyltransferase [Thermodesulfobacteriota bacterium]
MDKKKDFISEINTARGMAIVFVILGHYITILERDFSHVWTPALHLCANLIYTFIFTCDMPLFIFIAGLIFSHQQIKPLTPSSYAGFIKNKSIRLMLPYLVYSFAILAPKYILRAYAYRRPSDDLSAYLISNIKIILLYPLDNPMVVLWFIYTLFIVFALFPVIIWVAKKIGHGPALLIILALSFIPLPDILNLKNLGAYLLYFYLGYLFEFNREKNVRLLDRYRYILLSGLVILNCAFFYLSAGSINSYLAHAYKLSTAIVSIFALYELSCIITAKRSLLYRQLDLIGRYSYDVYLNGHLVQIALRILFVTLVPLDPIIVSLILIFGPIYIPIPIAYLFIRRYRLTSMLLLGIKNKGA